MLRLVVIILMGDQRSNLLIWKKQAIMRSCTYILERMKYTQIQNILRFFNIHLFLN